MTIALVQSKSGSGTSATTLTVTLTSPTTAGNFLVVMIGTFDGTTNPTVTGITLGGAAGNFAAANTQSSNLAVNSAIWADPNCAGGQTSVVISLTGGTGSGPDTLAWVCEFSGVATSSPLDKAPAGSVNTTGTTWSSNSTGTLSVPNELAVAMVACTAAVTGTPGLPWNELGALSATSLAVDAAWQAVTATTALVYNGTMTSGDESTAIIATFKAAGAASSGALLGGFP
jgi:hypothetical protein